MRVIDSRKASLAGTLLVASFGADVALMVLSLAVNRLVMPSFDGPWFVVEQLLWLATSVVTIVGLVTLSGAVEERALPLAAALAWIVMALMDVVSFATLKANFTSPTVSVLFNDLNMLVSLGGRGLLLVLLARLTMASRPWMVPLLATVGVLSLGCSALSLAMAHQVVSTELYRSPFYGVGTMALSLFNLAALFVAALLAKASLGEAQLAPARERALGLDAQAQGEPVSPASDFVVGGILLLVGIGVTAVSLSAASNGGRYIVATGAIGVGLGRLVRGFIRLGKS